MSNNKQTLNHNPNQSSVDWVIGEILKHEMAFFGTASIPLYIIEKGKEMHKHEIEKAHARGEITGFGRVSNPQFYEDKTPEQYYNETFGGNNEQQ